MEDASLTTKGVVKLSSAVDSTSESLAATPKAVKAANDNANSRLAKNQNGADIPDKGRFLSNINVYSKGEVDKKKGMRKYTFSAPANAVSGKWYPVVFRRTGGGTDELASRVVITTYSSVGGYAMNNCEFNGFVMPGGWSDRGSYAVGFFSIYSTVERSIHSIIASVKDDDLCSVFYVETRAFPIQIFAEEGLNVIVPTADYAVGQTTYKWGATDPLSESTNAQIILDFKNGRGYYCSHPFISSLSGNAATATKLQTARTIGGVSFDGTANINLPGVNTTGNQNTTGNAATATKLQTARTINGVSFDGSKNIELTPRSIGTINSATMSFSGGAGWFKLATVTMPQASSVVYISLIGGAGYNVGSPHQAGISELVLRAGNGNPKGITGALWRRTSVGFTNFAWVNTSGDTYDVYVEIGNYATGVNIQWDYTKDAIVQIHTSPTYTANKPTGLTDGTVYVIYSSHIKPTATDVGALPTTGGTLTGGLTAAGEIISKSANGLRIAYGSYGFFIRNDGSNTYFMLTNSGNSLGTYNSLRPLIINNANGAVTIANGLNVTGGVNGSLNGNASTATKLQTARKISGVSFDGSSDITLKASHVGAFALGQTGSRVANDKAVGWNWNSGVYDADISGSTTLILHFNMNVGSCPAVQFRVNYRNGGISYRSARDGYGFEEDWTQIYTKKDSIPGVNTTGNQNTTGNAATATKLQTARKIAGVAFDGSADITLTAANLNAYTKTEVTNLLSSYVKSSALPSMTVRTSSISGGDMGMSLSTFISHLKSNGAFSKRYWIGFGDAMGFNAGSINNITGFGAVELAESIIEVFNLPNGDYTIRLTTSHKADYGGVTNAILVYHYRSNRSPSGQWLKFAGTVGATSN
ncbi:phage tail protein [Escherichia coli]|nr:phage tail protein [Escherichia coli]